MILLKTKLKLRDQRSAFRVALIYVVISVLWIVITDHFVLHLFPRVEDFVSFQTIKGITFVFLSALVIYLLVRQNNRKKSKILAEFIDERKHYIDLKKRFQSLFEYGINCIATHRIVAHPDGTYHFPFTNVNHVFEKTFRINKMNVISGLPEKVHNVTYFNTIQDKMEQLAKSGTPLVYEWFDPDHSLYFEELIFISAPNELMRLITDITSRKKMELRLKEQEERLHLALNATQAGTWDWNIVNNRFFFDERFAKMLGYTKTEFDQIKGNPIEALIHPDDLHLASEYIKRIRDGEIDSIDINLRFFHKNGHIVWVWDKAEVVERIDGRPKRMVGTLIDISEQVATELELFENNRKLNVLINSLRGIVFRCKMDERYSMEFISDYCYEITGYKPEEFYPVGTVSFADVIYESDLDVIEKKLNKAYLEKSDYEIVYRIITKNGNIRWVSEKGDFESYDLPLEGQYLDGVIMDITDRIKLEEMKLKSAVNAEDRDRARISQSIHDGIQQYLFTSLVNIEKILKDKEKIPAEMVHKLELSFDYLNKSIEETRGIARELMPKNVQDFGLYDSVTHLIDHLDTPIDINFYSNLENERFSEDIEISLYRIIQEALTNALNYSNASEIYIQVIKTKRALNVSIEDNGKGFNLDSTDNLTKGLGLNLMRNRAESLGGIFDISSKPNKGTYIMTNIPLKYEKDTTS